MQAVGLRSSAGAVVQNFASSALSGGAAAARTHAVVAVVKRPATTERSGKLSSSLLPPLSKQQFSSPRSRSLTARPLSLVRMAVDDYGSTAGKDAPFFTDDVQLISGVETFVFDWDGVIWKGDKLIDGVPKTLDLLRSLGKKLIFVTNNSTKSRKQYGKKFESLGLNVSEEEIFSSSFAAAGYLLSINFPADKKVYVIGEVGILLELKQAGIQYLGGPDKTALRRTLEEDARQCQRLVLWLDCDQEGENIAYEVIEVCQASNPRLDIWRARISALIERLPLIGFPGLTQEIDLQIGASFTRFQTMFLQESFTFPFADEERKMVLSYGPCQFPTLGFVVERYWQVQAHIPEEFWTIKCYYNSDKGSCTFSWA